MMVNFNKSCANEERNFCEFASMFASKEVAMPYLAKGLEIHYLWFYVFGAFIAIVGLISLYTNFKVLQLFPK